MTGKKIGYIRVSTVDQNPERQLEGVELDKKFIEYASGTSLKRPVLDSMIDYVREEDIVYVHSIDRLARNVRDLHFVVDKLVEKGVTVHFVQQNLIFDGKQSPISNLLLIVLSAFSEFEHAIIKERQREGVQIAKAKGHYKGRRKEFNPMILHTVKTKMQTIYSKTKLAKECGISRTSLYRYLQKIKESESNEP